MKHFVFMLVILNPFAQVLYLNELIDRLSFRQFLHVHSNASLLSFGVFLLFALVGEPLLQDVFQVKVASLQIFGGLIMLVLAYRYVAIGPGSNVLFRGDINDLAPRISLPYMVGPGTIWIAIIIGRNYVIPVAVGIIAGVLFVNFLILVAYHYLQSRVHGQRETMVGK